MKKVFLFFASALAVVAAQAGGVLDVQGDCTTEDAGAVTIAIPFNAYGDGDKNGTGTIAHSWQGAAGYGKDVKNGEGRNLIYEAVEAYDEDYAMMWTIGLKQTFYMELTGTANATGKLKMGIVNEEEDAEWFTKMSPFASPEIEVTKDEEFSGLIVMEINKVVGSENGEYPETDLTRYPNLVIGFEMADWETGNAFGHDNDVVLSLSKCIFSYEPAANYENPYALGKIKTGYQNTFGGEVKGDLDLLNEPGNYVNVSINAVLRNGSAKNIQFGLISESNPSAEGGEAGDWFRMLTDEDGAYRTFIGEVAENGDVRVNFSLPILKSKSVNATSVESIKFVFFAESEYTGKKLVLDAVANGVVVDLSATPKYAEPTAVEEVAADLAIEGGVVYSAGQITVYNVAGQVVATAAQELNINALEAGVYFISAPEGTAKIVK